MCTFMVRLGLAAATLLGAESLVRGLVHQAVELRWVGELDLVTVAASGWGSGLGLGVGARVGARGWG